MSDAQKRYDCYKTDITDNLFLSYRTAALLFIQANYVLAIKRSLKFINEYKTPCFKEKSPKTWGFAVSGSTALSVIGYAYVV